MADLVAGDLTYTIQSESRGENGQKVIVAAITTAAGDYPTGGLPLTLGQLGTPNTLNQLVILEQSAADAYQYLWDKSENKILVLVDDGTSGVPAEHANAAFTSPDQLIVKAIGY